MARFTLVSVLLKKACIFFLQYYCDAILLLTINNHMLYKYTTLAGERALKWCKVGQKHQLCSMHNYVYVRQERVIAKDIWLAVDNGLHESYQIST